MLPKQTSEHRRLDGSLLAEGKDRRQADPPRRRSGGKRATQRHKGLSICDTLPRDAERNAPLAQRGWERQANRYAIGRLVLETAANDHRPSPLGPASNTRLVGQAALRAKGFGPSLRGDPKQ